MASQESHHVAAKDLRPVVVAEVGGAEAADGGRHRHVATEEEPVRAEHAGGHVHDTGIGDAPAQVEMDGGGVAKGLDCPLPVAAAADVAQMSFASG